MEPEDVRMQPSLPIHHQLIEIWRRLLMVKVSAIDESFFELGGASQSVSGMLKEVKRATGEDISAADFQREPTILGLTRCLLHTSTTNSLFVPIQKGGKRPPFYFFHGDILGAGFYSKRLAALLGADQPFHISPPIELGENELPSVEELAARKRRALQELQPHGPYFLGGFCVGAVVAYEVARQLENAGEDVRIVILIEPEIGDLLARSHRRIVDFLVLGRRTREKVNVFMRGHKRIERLRHVWRSPWPEKKEFVVKNTKKLLRKKIPTSTFDDGAAAEASGTMGKRDWLLSSYHWVLTSYLPKHYRGHVTMLLTNQQSEQAPFIRKQWQQAAPQLRVERTPGDHLSCITTHLKEIADKIRAEINAVKCFATMLMPTLGCQLSLFD
jgi:thioesterase domain-containing protein